MGYIFLVIALVLNASASILLKHGSLKLSADLGGRALGDLALMELFWKLLGNYFLIFGLIFFAVNVIFYFSALSRLNLSIAYPIMTTGGIAIITTYSMLRFGEHLSTLQLAGLVFLVVGIVLLFAAPGASSGN